MYMYVIEWVYRLLSLNPNHIIIINDLASVVKHSTVKMFADDVLLYAPANTLKECSSLQNDLTAISSWASHWQLKLNPTNVKL